MAQSDNRRRAYEQWVRAHGPELYRFAYRFTGKRESAEDLVQETFAEAWRSMDKQREPARARAWLYQILRYRCAHFVRDASHRVMATSAEGVVDGLASTATPRPGEEMANREVLQQALDRLTPELRETFLLVFMEGLTCREAGELLEIPLGTVLSRLDRARQVLRPALREAAGDGSKSRVPGNPESMERKDHG